MVSERVRPSWWGRDGVEESGAVRGYPLRLAAQPDVDPVAGPQVLRTPPHGAAGDRLAAAAGAEDAGAGGAGARGGDRVDPGLVDRGVGGGVGQLSRYSRWAHGRGGIRGIGSVSLGDNA